MKACPLSWLMWMLFLFFQWPILHHPHCVLAMQALEQGHQHQVRA
jgi:hypothetical protein